jgi:hypothetical protein
MLFAAFVSIFALDVFGEGRSFGQTLLALAMHLIPTAVILVGLALSWRWEWVGGGLYLALGMTYIVWAWGRFPPSVYIVIAGPCFLLSALFFVGWLVRRELRGGGGSTAHLKEGAAARSGA